MTPRDEEREIRNGLHYLAAFPWLLALMVVGACFNCWCLLTIYRWLVVERIGWPTVPFATAFGLYIVGRAFFSSGGNVSNRKETAAAQFSDVVKSCIVFAFFLGAAGLVKVLF